MTITFTLLDLLVFAGIICLIAITVMVIYMILTLRDLRRTTIELQEKSTKLMDESYKIVKDAGKVVGSVEAASSAVIELSQDMVAKGQTIFRLLKLFKKHKDN